jgi:hypothetical protein
MLPQYITQLFHTYENSGYELHSSNLKLFQPKPEMNFLKNSFSYSTTEEQRIGTTSQ